MPVISICRTVYLALQVNDVSAEHGKNANSWCFVPYSCITPKNIPLTQRTIAFTFRHKESYMPELALMKDSRVLSEWPLDDKEVMIGRGPDCHIVLEDPLASWHHAKIVKAYGGYMIEDLGSTNGIIINGRRVSKQMLKFGDKAIVGTHELCLNRSIDDRYSVPTEKTVGVESLGMGGVSSSVTSNASGGTQKTGATARIRFLTGPDSGSSETITSIPYTISKPGGNLGIINRKGDVYILQHLSGGRVSINGNPVSNEGTSLKNGDKFQVGNDEMRFLAE